MAMDEFDCDNDGCGGRVIVTTGPGRMINYNRGRVEVPALFPVHMCQKCGDHYLSLDEARRLDVEIVLEKQSKDTSWIDHWKHCQSDHPMVDAIMDTFKDMSAEMRAMIKRFPPMCLVKAMPGKRVLGLYGESVGAAVAIVYHEEKLILHVIQHPETKIVGFASPDDLEVVGYHGQFSQERVDRVLEAVAKELAN